MFDLTKQSIWKMEELVEKMVEWKIHPEQLVTHQFQLRDADKAYSTAANAKQGKVRLLVK